MNGQTKWYALLVAALGMTAGLMGAEIAALESWEPILTPAFVGRSLMSLATVIGAFVAGKKLPQS